MGLRPMPLAPGWARLASTAIDRAMDVVLSDGLDGKSRLFKMEVRPARGQLHLLWLLQPEDRVLVDRLRKLRHQLAATSIETCEVCGRHVPWVGVRRREVLCEAHDAPF